MKYRSKISADTFVRDVLVMFTGTAIGQLGTVLLSPVLTRIYTPDMFGVLGIFTAIIGLLAVISALRFELALPLVQSDKEAADLFAVCVAALFLTTFLAVFFIGGVSHAGETDMIFGRMAPYRWLIPLGFFCIGAYQVMVAYATRYGTFRIVAHTKVYQGVVGPVSQIGMGLLGSEAWGLVLGFVLGQSAGVIALFKRLIWTPKALTDVTLQGMLAMAKRFRRFMFYSSWTGLLEFIGGAYLLLFTVPLLYSNTLTGYIFLTDRVIGRPLLMIGTSILQVYLGAAPKDINNDPAAMKKRFLQLSGQQLVIVAAWLLIVNAAAPYAMPVIFGEKWSDAVPYLHVLSIAYLPQMVIIAITHTLQILEKQELSAAWEIGRLVALVAALGGSYLAGASALYAILAYSVVQALAYIILFILMYRSVQSIQRENKE